ncbi:MAG: hypothetical protein FJY06_02985 [Bacteroidetes bacterium]|nr:hypothetical protein [Bacteroidota bacterium]
MRASIGFLCLFVLMVLPSWAQVKTEIIQQRIEFISERFQSEAMDLTNIIEQLNYFYEHPINLNETEGIELEDLGLLTTIQISDLLRHRKLFGKLITIYELQSLTFWDLQTIELVQPFIRVDDKLDNIHVSFKEALRQGKFEWFLRYQPTVEPRLGYEKVSDSLLANSNNYYYGNSDRYYTRFRYTYKTNFSLGVTAEKDPGEEFFRGSQNNGFDFYSAHLFFKGGKYVRGVALGDYQVQIGQGIGFWSSYAFGKTAEIATVKRTAIPLRAYTSVDENRFLRGAAVDLGYKNFGLLLFTSSKRVDAAVIADSVYDDLEFISTLDLTGLHRTNREILKKNALRENIVGANLNFHKGLFRIGATGVYQGYDRPFLRDLKIYNQFDFRGQHHFNFATDYSFNYKNISLFGEVAKAFNDSLSAISSGWAMIHGALISFDSRVSFGLVYRDYQRDYFSFYNAGFSEGGNTQNERGLYSGIKMKFNSKWSLNGYVDLFKFPWMKYSVDGPSRGHEFLVQPVYKPNKILEVYFRFRQQLRERNSSVYEGSVTPIETYTQRNYRLNLTYVVSESFTLKSRIEFLTINSQSKGLQKGMIATQDFLWKPKDSPIDFALRYALFDTDGYDTRIYSFENNALYVFAVPAYYYQGSRAYLLVRYFFLKRFDLSIRYGYFLYNNRFKLSSGPEQINGSRKSDFVIQLRINF